MTQQDYNLMINRGKDKKDGLYSFKGGFYIVFDKQVAAYCDYFGNIYERSYGFSISKGKSKDRFEAKNVLKGYLKQYKNR